MDTTEVLLRTALEPRGATMTLKLEGINAHKMINLFVKPEHNYMEATAGCGGVSFPSSASVKRFVVTASVVAIGTSPIVARSTVKPLQNVRLSLPIDGRRTPADIGEHYKRLRTEIVAAGIPLLSDEELREEIRDRKGVREP